MGEHRTAVDFGLTGLGWRYRPFCRCGWTGKAVDMTRIQAESTARGHVIAMTAMDDAEREFRATTSPAA